MDEASLAHTLKTLHCYHLVIFKTAFRMQFFEAIQAVARRASFVDTNFVVLDLFSGCAMSRA
jgi:hypothetical protein